MSAACLADDHLGTVEELSEYNAHPCVVSSSAAGAEWMAALSSIWVCFGPISVDLAFGAVNRPYGQCTIIWRMPGGRWRKE